VRGLLELDALRELVEAERVDTVLTVFPDLYGRLVGKRVTGHFFLDHVAREGMHACDYLLACDMEMDPVPGYAFTSWAQGYGDVRLVPDLRTLRVASWLEGTAVVLCDVYEEERDVLVEVAPRSVLRRQLDRARALGYTAMGLSLIHI
jgi:glutamine synthetase